MYTKDGESVKRFSPCASAVRRTAQGSRSTDTNAILSATVTKPDLVVSRDRPELAAEAVRRVVAAAHDAITQRQRFTLVLSGGSTPQLAYEMLASPQNVSQMDWSRTWLFFGDERCVPSDDPRSNYHMAAQALLEPVRIPADHVLAIPTDRGTPALSAAAYESQLRQFFGLSESGTRPHFDLVLLGLGNDGHTASLFPGMPSLDETRAWAVGTPPGVLPPPVDRVTLTFPVFNAARKVLFLVSGEEKATIVRDLLEGQPDVKRRPASGIRPTSGRLTWLLDEPAAAKLSPTIKPTTDH